MSFLCEKCHTSASCFHPIASHGPCEDCGTVDVCVDCHAVQPAPVKKPAGWIAVDLDGTLSFYAGHKGISHIGDPVPAMVERVKRWLAEGRDVRIFTARVTAGQDARDLLLVRRVIETWCSRHLGRVLPITNVKDYAMDELWDDRAVAVEPNTGRMLSPSRRGLE